MISFESDLRELVIPGDDVFHAFTFIFALVEVYFLKGVAYVYVVSSYCRISHDSKG
jgi:hypothetical protein